MSFSCRRQHGSTSPKMGLIRQKLHFSPSDGEEEDCNNSTGAESGFTELDSPLRRQNSAESQREDGDVELWDEEGFGSPSPVKQRRALVKGSPSPRKSPRSYDSSSPEIYRREDREGSSSPIPDCPDTPPHKTFRKLRLFDTPHTPKVTIILLAFWLTLAILRLMLPRRAFAPCQWHCLHFQQWHESAERSEELYVS